MIVSLTQPSVEQNQFRFRVAGAAFAFILSLALYLWTLAPVVTYVDSGEIAASVVTRGVSHPSGSPFYHLLALLPAAIPLGTVIQRLNAFSAICAAASVAFTFLILRADRVNAVPAASPVKKKKKKGKQKQEPALQPIGLANDVMIVGAMAAAFSWMTCKALWNSATVTEVYGLHALLIAMISWLLFLPPHFVFAAAVIGGFGISNYPPFGILGPAVLLLLWKNEGAVFWKNWKRLAVLLFCFAAGLLPFLLLPLRASTDPLLNWGNPSDWQHFWKHISAEQYRVFLNSPRLALIPKTLGLWREQWNVAVLFLIPIGIFALKKIRSDLWLYSLLVAILNLLYMLSYDVSDVESAPSDIFVYILPLCWVSSLWIGAAVVWIIGKVRDMFPASSLRHLGFLVAMVPLLSLISNWRLCNKRDYTYADDFARSILSDVAPNALILSPDWTFVSPSLYLQHVERIRTDVVVLDGELLRRSWYFRYLEKRSPQIYEAARDPISDFLKEVSLFEEGKEYDGNIITEKYVVMLNSLLDSAQRLGHPPYILLNREAKELDPAGFRNFEKVLGHPPYYTSGVAPQAVGGEYLWIPETLAFRLVPAESEVVLPEIEVPPRAYPSGRKYDSVTQGVMNRYADFWRYRGDFFQQQQDCYQAVPAYQKALQIVPDLQEALEGIDACK